jgi:hypothetical protein
MFKVRRRRDSEIAETSIDRRQLYPYNIVHCPLFEVYLIQKDVSEIGNDTTVQMYLDT